MRLKRLYRSSRPNANPSPKPFAQRSGVVTAGDVSSADLTSSLNSITLFPYLAAEPRPYATFSSSASRATERRVRRFKGYYHGTIEAAAVRSVAPDRCDCAGIGWPRGYAGLKLTLHALRRDSVDTARVESVWWCWLRCGAAL